MGDQVKITLGAACFSEGVYSLGATKKVKIVIGICPPLQ
jgi:hypothetical protein